MTTFPSTPETRGSFFLTAILLWLAGLFLRVPILVAPPLAPLIRQDLSLSEAATGALTTLPVLFLGIGAMAGALGISRVGPRNALVLALSLTGLASAARGLAPDLPTLLIATAFTGLGIAIMQPSLPALLPRWLEPRRIALGSAIYMNGMLMGEFIGAGLTLPVIMPLTNDSWRLTLIAWSVPAIAVALALLIPRRDKNQPVRRPAWLPDWQNPLTLRLGLLLGASASMFFGLNAYLSSLLAQRGELASLDRALLIFNLAQVIASLFMLVMASRWIGRRDRLVQMLAASAAALVGVILLSGWWSIAMAALLGFFAGVVLIFLVALPPQVTTAEQTGRLAAGNFLIGYVLAFVIPLAGGLIADATGDVRHALWLILIYGVLVLPMAARLPLGRQGH